MRLQVEGLTYSYGEKDAVEQVSLQVDRGEFVGLIGPNGSGKSTVLKNIYRGLTPDQGTIELDKENLLTMPYKKSALKMAVVGQENEVPFDFMVEEIVAMGRSPHKKLFDVDNAHDKEIVHHALEHMGMAHMAKRSYLNLSGGEKQRVLIARTIAQESDFLILDEPTNHLDMRSKDVLKEAIREFDGTVILVSHDRDFLDGLATKVYEFGGGLVKEHLGGIYEFLQKKKIDSLNELQKGAGLSASPTASAKGNEPETVQPSENKLSYEAQKELNKKIKKLERQVADCEASIEETESAIAIVEAKMATPEGASDMQLYERHQKLKQQLDTIVEEWERVSMELEEAKN